MMGKKSAGASASQDRYYESCVAKRSGTSTFTLSVTYENDSLQMKKMADPKASHEKNPKVEKSAYVSRARVAAPLVQYETTAGLTKSESVVYPLKRGRRHLSLGICSPDYVGGRPPQCGFFSSVCLCALVNGRALAGERSRSPVPTFRSANPVMRPPTPFCSGERASNITSEAAMRAISFARSEQTVPLVYIDIIQCAQHALREATLAASDLDALDITGNALRQLMDIARAEVRHD
ncbi:hypothetical protein [Caballeronia sp. HLA56]